MPLPNPQQKYLQTLICIDIYKGWNLTCILYICATTFIAVSTTSNTNWTHNSLGSEIKYTTGTHTSSHIHSQVCGCAHSHAYIHRHTFLHTPIHRHTSTHTHTFIHRHTSTHTQHTFIHIQHTHSSTSTHNNTHSSTHTSTHTHPQTHNNTHIHPDTQAHIHTHTQHTLPPQSTEPRKVNKVHPPTRTTGRMSTKTNIWTVIYNIHFNKCISKPCCCLAMSHKGIDSKPHEDIVQWYVLYWLKAYQVVCTLIVFVQWHKCYMHFFMENNNKTYPKHTSKQHKEYWTCTTASW